MGGADMLPHFDRRLERSPAQSTRPRRDPTHMRKPFVVLPAVLIAALAWRVPMVIATAEIHRFDIVFSAVPTQLRAKDFNAIIDNTNRTQLEPRGLAPLKK